MALACAQRVCADDVCDGPLGLGDSAGFADSSGDLLLKFKTQQEKADDALRTLLSLEVSQVALVLVCAVQARPTLWESLVIACANGISREEAMVLFANQAYVEDAMQGPLGQSSPSQPMVLTPTYASSTGMPNLGNFPAPVVSSQQNVNDFASQQRGPSSSFSPQSRATASTGSRTFFPDGAVGGRFAPSTGQNSPSSYIPPERSPRSLSQDPYNDRRTFRQSTLGSQSSLGAEQNFDSFKETIRNGFAKEYVNSVGQQTVRISPNSSKVDVLFTTGVEEATAPDSSPVTPSSSKWAQRGSVRSSIEESLEGVTQRYASIEENSKRVSVLAVAPTLESKRVSILESNADDAQRPEVEVSPTVSKSVSMLEYDVDEQSQPLNLVPPQPKYVPPPRYKPPPQRKPVAIIQFSAPIYFCNEEDEYVVVEVQRLGPNNQVATVMYETRDHTAKAGKKYGKTDGQLKYAVGDSVKEIKIPIIANDSFDAALEFEVALKTPVNGILGRYLNRTVVKVIDDDAFPTNKFRDKLLSDRIEEIPKFKLLVEYFKMNYQNPTVHRGTIKAMLLDVCHSLYFLWRLNLTRYLIDAVLSPPKAEEGEVMIELSPEQKQQYLMAIMLAIVVPFSLLHILDIRKLTWKVGGTSRKILQANLLRKFLNYDEESRGQVGDSALIMAMTRDTEMLIGRGYAQIIVAFKNVFKLGLILCQNVAVPFWYGESPQGGVMGAVLMFPVIMICFLKLRDDKTERVSHEESVAQNNVVEHVQQAITSYRLLADFNRQASFVDEYEKKIGILNGAMVKSGIVDQNNKFFAPWLATLLVGLYTLWGGYKVIHTSEDTPPEDALTLGVFLLNLEIFKEIGAAWAEIYDTLLSMQSTFPNLHQVVRFMNLPVDIQKRLVIAQKRNAFGRKTYTTLSSKRLSSLAGATVDDDHPFLVDQIKIVVRDMEYRFSAWVKHDQGIQEDPDITASFSIDQGTFVALVSNMIAGAPNAGGKTTLLKIIGGVLLPEHGVEVPPHLRVLHISEHPLFFAGSLHSNLVFGVLDAEGGGGDGRDDRVLSICRKLMIPEKVLSHYKEQALCWGEILSATQRSLLHLARALIANPELLCIHRPTRSFDSNSPEFNNTLEVLRAFVDERGLVQDEHSWCMRRPRTCIITAGRAAGNPLFDRVLTVEGHLGVQEIPVAS